MKEEGVTVAEPKGEMSMSVHVEVYIEAARMARDNAHSRRRTAAIWPPEHREWIDHDLAEASAAFQRARYYLRTARQLRAFQ